MKYGDKVTYLGGAKPVQAKVLVPEMRGVVAKKVMHLAGTVISERKPQPDGTVINFQSILAVDTELEDCAELLGLLLEVDGKEIFVTPDQVQ